MHDNEFYKFIVELCQKSGPIIRQWYLQDDIGLESKSDNSPVTRADLEAEEALREAIAQRYPDHGIIGEEFGSENENAEFVWTLDPIDGTLSFVAGVPLFGTLVGLLHQGRPLLGAIHQPIVNQLCIGDGKQTELNAVAVNVRACPKLENAMILATDLLNIDRFQNKTGFDSLLRQGGMFRGWGDCYGYLLVACGRADIMLDPIMNPWDILPVIPIIEGAGGSITTWEGADPLQGNSCVATGGMGHESVINILNSEIERVT